MTGQEIIERLKEFFGDNEGGISSYAFGYYEDAESVGEYKGLSFSERREKAKELLGLGEIKEVDSYGGEGQGETWYTIKHFVDHDVYIRTDGFYSSYNGTDFYDGWGEEVKPVQKTVTVYE